ncbi:WbqC family protein [Pontibacter sp. 13R65]|uniref:WbqC family protein n=1 Tax=Pontibacter sp. 13R65 TaxID=3127458 RepID=UPI00301C51B3
MILLTELHYHPPIEYFRQVLRADSIVVEQHENYIKQSYRNRCHVLTAHGMQALAVPVLRGNSKNKTRITDIEIDYSQKWQQIHWRTLQSAYGKAPYFEFYQDAIQAVYQQHPKNLFELNLNLLRLYLKFLKINKPLELSHSYLSVVPDNVLDLRNQIHPKINPDNLHVKPYYQVFGNNFVPELSIIDLLFTQGPAASAYL